MLPRWHILLGAIFTLIVWAIVPMINILNLLLIFGASFLIDFDHYAASVLKTKRFGLLDSFEYHKKMNLRERREYGLGIRRKGDFHLFHTVEFHALIGFLSIPFSFFFYVFIGMIFHSLLDVISLVKAKRMYRREFFFFNWLMNKINH